MAGPQKSVLFVCLGNICRSPIAEAVFRDEVMFKGLEDQWVVDSAGTSDWNIGSSPDSRGIDCLHRYGKSSNHIARQWLIDSCGIGHWHIGEKPDKRARECLKQHKLETYHRGRQLEKADFSKFQYILGMDENNIKEIKKKMPKDSTATVKLLGEYDPEKQLIIVDPYYGGEDGFERVYQQVLRCCKAFLEEAMAA
ncbi:low molecular weight phosphotyrosine protein phosphatase isoform X1 [Lingula anatina]|uniref:Low molecular weight phosphotyrosine protein phosphatase n=1 Tax=Lingula anatina TaxID=7574 RepID=A0A1S3JN02_LINAN|nr:low molecular weight phosphotyrosine protein phosphatase isoform X1 [Lingula anatina]|eukprot:XP_013411755.1 low molecular weight phosphotyrosine protein phosphatase isoform X1 [Lingula anatina]